MKFVFIAIDQHGKRIYAEDATKESIYYCPVCNNTVVLRAGLVNVSHFAHIANQCDDDWNYDMSPWHRKMQSFFPVECREVVLKHDGKTHRADVLLGDTVIEIQHSPISAEEFEDRNSFFTQQGYRMVWIFDMRKKCEEEQIHPLNDQTETVYRWLHPMRIFQSLNAPLTDYDKRFAVYFHLYEDVYEDVYEECSSIDRVVWTAGNSDGIVDFSRFAISEEALFMNEVLNPDAFFVPLKEKRRELARRWLDGLLEEEKEKGFRHTVKYIGEKKKPRVAYTCDRWAMFGLQVHGDHACTYCKHCAMILSTYSNKKRKFAIYCCYPYVYRQPDKEAHPGFDCNEVSTIEY